MLELSKKIVLDENQNPIAVQIPIAEFERIEEIIENYGLAKMMEEVADDEQLSVHEAKNLYRSLKQDVEG
jgi:rubrerythrin